jgi:hypothetical protein
MLSYVRTCDGENTQAFQLIVGPIHPHLTLLLRTFHVKRFVNNRCCTVYRLDVYTCNNNCNRRAARSREIHLPIPDGRCTMSGRAVDKHVGLGGKSNIGWSLDRSFRKYLPFACCFPFWFLEPPQKALVSVGKSQSSF